VGAYILQREQKKRPTSWASFFNYYLFDYFAIEPNHLAIPMPIIIERKKKRAMLLL